MAGPPLPAELHRALQSGATVLTANQRAARTLRLQVDLDHRAQGHTTWQPPAIFAWESWTAVLWHQLLIAGRAASLLLNSAQEHSLWRAIIADDPAWSGLPTADALAELATDAFARLCAYSGESRLGRDSTAADTRAFVHWTRAFLDRCRQEDLLPPAQLEARLVECLIPADLPRTLLLIGFDAVTSARQSLLGHLQARGTYVTHLSLGEVQHLSLTASPGEDDELATAARWLHAHLLQDPTARLALIVPNLEARRPEIDRVLHRTLSPAHTAAPRPFLYEFSLGLSLARIPAVAVALDLLRWPLGGGLSRERVTRLLLSPALGGHQAERLPRAAADARLRRERSLRPVIPLERLLRTLDTNRIPVLRASLYTYRRLVETEDVTQPRSYADWTELFRRLLAAASWGDEADSLTFQAVERWESVLDQAATLDFSGLRVPYRDALATVERLATQTLFAPESEDAPIQILGPLEAAGSTFDALWFLGAGDLTWPRRPATSPLLPWSLQRDLAMPGTDAAADMAHAQRLADRISRSAAAVIFSYARELPDTARQRPSPALSELPLSQTSAHQLAPAEPLNQLIALEVLDDSHTLPAPPNTVLRGGTSILQHQAACGFRAFAEHRLFATALDATRPSANFGFDPRDSGGAIHQILQIFWTRIRTQDELKALPPLSRLAMLSEAIEQAVAPTALRNTGPWDAAYLDMQCERLLASLDGWLQKEIDRAVPFRIRALEADLPDAQIGPLHLALRVDRIDETEFGDVILDYKTGLANPSDWLGERPDAPQLPLYAVLAAALPGAAPLAGIAFAQLRAGDTMGLHGFQAEDGVLLTAAKLDTPLAVQLDQWRVLLERLATEFHQGDVRVRPKAYPHTCQYCEQRLLCRLDLSLLNPIEDASLSAEDDPFG